MQSVDRAVALLRALAKSDAPVPLAVLAESCGIERPTAWRLLWTLQTHGLVERAEPLNGYRLAFGALELTSSHAVDSLARLGRPILNRLAEEHGVTASLAYVERFGLVYIDQVDSTRFSSPNWKGRSMSLHGSSPGKAVLAALSPAEARGMLGPTLEYMTETTITDFDELQKELAGIRAQGYAVCRGEDVTFSNGSSAVVTLNNRPIAAIDLWGPERMVPLSSLPDLGAAAVAAALELQRHIGAVPAD